MRNFDFSSWQAVLSTIAGIAIFALVGIGIRLLMMMTIQRRQQRMNRQINERLKVLIAAYKVLGGSFTGDLSVDPRHLRDIRQGMVFPPPEGEADIAPDQTTPPWFERRRQIRDAVEAALSDIILLGTEEQVRLAARAAQDLVEQRPVMTAELVASLRDFIRQALDLDPMPKGLTLPAQGPARPASGASRGKEGGRGTGGGGEGGGGGGGAGMGGGMAMGGMGLGLGAAAGRARDDGA